MFAVLISIFVGILLHVYRTQQTIDRQIATAKKIHELTNQLISIRNDSQTSLLSYRYHKDEAYLRNINSNKETVNRLIPEMYTLLSTDTGKALLSEYDRSRKPLQESRNKFIEAMQSNDDQRIAQSFDIWEIHAAFSAAALQDVSNYNFNIFERTQLVYREILSQTYAAGVILTVLIIVFLIVMYYYLKRVITLPVQEISAAAHQVSQGKFDTSVTVRSSDELGKLSNDINGMAVKLKQYYDHLQSEMQRKDEFISIASHELKTPVTSLKAFVQILKRKSDESGEHDLMRYLTKMDEQILRLTGLIANLLDVARIQSGKMPFEMKKFDLNACIGDIVEVNSQITKKHRIIVKGSVNKLIYGDEDRICQVLNNLITNAVKYSPKKDTVEIHITNTPDNVLVSVRDFGIGIDKKHQKKIFERFYRVSGSVETTFPGLGIGLYISSEIIRRHGGKLYVESTKGKGSTFSFTLPFHT